MPKELFSTIKKWTMQDQIFKLKLPDKENTEWAIELTYPFKHPAPMTIYVVQPKKRDFLVVEIPIRMSDVHLNAFNKKGKAAFGVFYYQLRKLFLNKNLSYNINQSTNSWVISEQIYIDGLTKNEFFKTIRKVYNTMMLGNMLIEEILNSKIIGPIGKNPAGFKGNMAGGNLYS
ncbi:MAG: DUF2299 family protein [Promethearchaeota archaeon]